MNSSERVALMGNELTTAVDGLVGAFACTPEQHAALGDLIAAVLGRVTSLAASKIVEQHNLVERVDALERGVGGEAQ